MGRRLKSNIKFVWWNFVSSLFLCIIMPFCVAACWIEKTSMGMFILLLTFCLVLFAVAVFTLVHALLDWQWVTVYKDRITVRCLLFEIRSIPVEKIKRCWVCPVWIQYYKSWGATYHFIVIDTAKTRKKHTIPDGFSSRKRRYIILPDTFENRYALRHLSAEVRRELL